MKSTLSIAIVSMTVALAAGFAPSTAANAQSEYPWCASTPTAGGVTLCSYSTVEQCKAFLGNQGGTCQLNPRFVARSAADRKTGR